MCCGLMMKAVIVLGSLKPKRIHLIFIVFKKNSKASGKKPYGTSNHKGNYTSLYKAIPLEKRVTLLFIIIFYEVTSMKSWKYYHMNCKG